MFFQLKWAMDLIVAFFVVAYVAYIAATAIEGGDDPRKRVVVLYLLALLSAAVGIGAGWMIRDATPAEVVRPPTPAPLD